MKRLLLPAAIFAAWMALLGSDIPAAGGFLPAPGKFFNPFQGIWQSVREPSTPPMIQGGVSGETRILFDERAVPHIYAPTLADALYAQGWLHATNRLFQMDLTARATAGRLSEWLGPRTFEFDKRRREMGMEWLAKQKAAAWSNDPETLSLLDAYVKGVNAAIATTPYRDLPVEYKILNQAPPSWTIEHSALAGLSLSIALCLKEDDVDLTRARARLTPEDFAFLFPDRNPQESPVIPDGTAWAFAQLAIPAPVPPDPTDPGGRAPVAIDRNVNGSNNWAVSPARTAAGHALLANDPHLNQTLPAIWYEMEIHTPDMHVHGVSVPGIPLVIIGFNENVAWGTTNSGQDVLDWYKITWQDSTRLKYRLDGRFVDAQLRPETIDVRGRRPIIDTVRYTQFGPVSTLGDHRDLAMKWIPWVKARENEVQFLHRIDRASTVADYRDAVSRFPYPAQNKVFASVTGDIAMTVSGVVPLRDKTQGQSVCRGDTTAADWTVFLPFDQNPFTINPDRGYVSSANQAPASDDYPYPQLGRHTFEDWRGRMVNRLLDSLDRATVEDMKRMQQDNYDLQAAELLPILFASLQSGACDELARDPWAAELSNWDYTYHRDSISPIAYDLWYRLLEAMMYDELDSLGVIRPEEWRTAAIVRDHPDHAIFDRIATTDVRETAADIICASFENMRDSLANLPSESKTNWGSFKATALPHLARLPGFGVEGLHASGGDHIINAQKKSHGPSWRMIVELTDPPQAWVNYPGGQSGHPASPHYADFVSGFFEGEYHNVRLRPDANAWTPQRMIKILP
jgi:penicillin amidase